MSEGRKFKIVIGENDHLLVARKGIFLVEHFIPARDTNPQCYALEVHHLAYKEKWNEKVSDFQEIHLPEAEHSPKVD